MLHQGDSFMLMPFFVLAARSPTRQQALRRATVAHLLLLSGVMWAMLQQRPAAGLQLLGNVLLTAGIVEGAVLVGWRLSQMPKSQALEFMLVSPLRPNRLLIAEALVGLGLHGLVTLSGLPLLGLLAVCGVIDRLDPAVLLVMPFTWGAITGLGLTVWAYEPPVVRRWGERVMIALLLLYLVVGVVAGENLKRWLDEMPAGLASVVLTGFAAFHTHNPFGVMSWWMANNAPGAWERTAGLEIAALALLALLIVRAGQRLQPHFHERHYQPAVLKNNVARPRVSSRPLRWWAVKRVSEYSGRINLWLAGGFGVLYALYLVAGDSWPTFVGRRVFELCDNAGGVAGVTTGLVILAAVPAAFQYGLWDSNAQDRCRRLELLLLTRLEAIDYWEAATAAAWKRGRGYFAVAILLWVAADIAGRLTAPQCASAMAVGVLLWSLYFSLGFRAFTRGGRANGLGMALTVGLPLAAYSLARSGYLAVAELLPAGGMFVAAAGGISVAGLTGAVLAGALSIGISRRSLRDCDGELRRWYDRECGSKVAC
jgi:hypothetical protein